MIHQRPVMVAASHGTDNAEGQRAVAALVDQVRVARPDLSVVAAFVDVQQPSVESVLADLDQGRPAVVVPLLLSAGFHVHVDLREISQSAPGLVTVTGALGPDPRLAEVLAQRLAQAGFDQSPGSADAVVLATAGSSNDSAVEDCRSAAALLSERIGCEVTVSFLAHADPPVSDAVTAVRERCRGRVFVSSYLLAPGYFHNLAARAGGDKTTAPLLVPDGPLPTEIVEIVSDLYDRHVP